MCVFVYYCEVVICFNTLLDTTSSRSHEQYVPTSPNAAYEDIDKVNTNINPAYGKMRETTRQQHVTYEEIIM